MKLLGWVLAYWGFWVTLGSFLLMVRYRGWCEEWQEIRSYPILDKLKFTYAFLVSVTLWPREYRNQAIIEEFLEDEDDDDEDDWMER